MGERMKLRQTSIPGLGVAESTLQIDERGFFTRLYCKEELREIIGTRQIVQINQSRTQTVGTVRGLHYQHAPHAEMKLVRCIKGRVWDVAVDLRAGSSTCLKWHAEELSEANANMMVIPEGCAHGFQVLEEDTELLYLHTAIYTPSAEGGIRPTDPRLSISWPLAIENTSDRDRNHPLLTSEFTGLAV
jgi:dTDP-4-dehydrorhamnose 3,5-epimerase